MQRFKKRKKKLKSRRDSGKKMTTPRLMQIALRCGINLSSLPMLTCGEFMDIIEYHLDDVLRSHGKDVIDYDEQYDKLIKLKPQIEAGYKAGQIDEEKYRRFMKRLDDLTE